MRIDENKYFSLEMCTLNRELKNDDNNGRPIDFEKKSPIDN